MLAVTLFSHFLLVKSPSVTPSSNDALVDGTQWFPSMSAARVQSPALWSKQIRQVFVVTRRVRLANKDTHLIPRYLMHSHSCYGRNVILPHVIKRHSGLSSWLITLLKQWGPRCWNFPRNLTMTEGKDSGLVSARGKARLLERDLWLDRAPCRRDWAETGVMLRTTSWPGQLGLYLKLNLIPRTLGMWTRGAGRWVSSFLSPTWLHGIVHYYLLNWLINGRYPSMAFYSMHGPDSDLKNSD